MCNWAYEDQGSSVTPCINVITQSNHFSFCIPYNKTVRVKYVSKIFLIYMFICVSRTTRTHTWISGRQLIFFFLFTWRVITRNLNKKRGRIPNFIRRRFYGRLLCSFAKFIPKLSSSCFSIQCAYIYKKKYMRWARSIEIRFEERVRRRYVKKCSISTDGARN